MKQNSKLAILSLYAGLASTTLSALEPQKGFTAAESMIWSNEGSAENRLYLNATARSTTTSPADTPFVAGIHSFNSISGINQDSYFGSHRLSLGTPKIGLEISDKTIANRKPTQSYGVRIEQGLPFSKYGYTEVTANNKGMYAQVLSGYKVDFAGLSYLVEFTFWHNMPNRKPTSTSAELQLLHGAKNKLQPFILGQAYAKQPTRVGIGVRGNF